MPRRVAKKEEPIEDVNVSESEDDLSSSEDEFVGGASKVSLSKSKKVKMDHDVCSLNKTGEITS